MPLTREQSSARIAAAFAALPVCVPDPQPSATVCPPPAPKSDHLRDNPLFWVATAVFAVMVIMVALPWYRSTSEIAMPTPSVEGVVAPAGVSE